MNKDYRIMKFFKPTDKLSKAKGYMRFETRGTRGTFNITVENISNQDDISEIYILKNNKEKIRLGSINSKKGTITKNISIINLDNKNTPIEDFDICMVSKNNKPVLCTTIFSNKDVDYSSLVMSETNKTITKKTSTAKIETKKYENQKVHKTENIEKTKEIKINSEGKEENKTIKIDSVNKQEEDIKEIEIDSVSNQEKDTKEIETDNVSNQEEDTKEIEIDIVNNQEEDTEKIEIDSVSNQEEDTKKIEIDSVSKEKEDAEKVEKESVSNQEEHTEEIEIDSVKDLEIEKADELKKEIDEKDREAQIASAIAEKIVNFKDKMELPNKQKDITFKKDEEIKNRRSNTRKTVTREERTKSKIKQENENEYTRIYDILDKFERIEPLKDDIKGLKWWKISYDDKSIYRGFLPFFNQIISVYYPYPLTNRVTTCQNLMKKHGFYIFGIYEEKNRIAKYVYGIPGKFLREEQPYRGITGFKNWSYKNNEVLDGDYGFWLAFISAVNGDITDPPKISK